VTRTFAEHVGLGELAEFRVAEGGELIEGSGIAFVPRAQQSDDRILVRGHATSIPDRN